VFTVKVGLPFEVLGIVRPPRLEVRVKEGTTVKVLLRQLIKGEGSILKEVLLDSETEEIKPFFWIFLGGRAISLFPQGMDTPLKENDVVSVIVMPYGGG